MPAVKLPSREISRSRLSTQSPSPSTTADPSTLEPHRPRFNSHNTQDRLRESTNRLPATCPSMSGSASPAMRKERRSMFREVGLVDDDYANAGKDGGSGTPPAFPEDSRGQQLGDLASLSSTSTARQATNDGGGLPGIVVSQQEAGPDGRGGAPGATGAATAIRESGNGGQQQLRQQSRGSQAQPAQSTSSKAQPSVGARSNDHATGASTGSIITGSNTNNTNPKIENATSPTTTTPGVDTPVLTSPTSPTTKQSWFSKLPMGRRPRIKAAASAPPPPTVTSLSRVTMIAMLIAVVLPAFSYNNGRQKVGVSGADAGVVNSPRGRRWEWWQHQDRDRGSALVPRANSPTQVCTRWAHQTALLNGTVYIYGGQTKTSADQKTNTWNNNFLTLDLTKSWDTKTPILNGLPQPSGPPKVAMGYLWNDYNNLYLYGGQSADNPFAEPSRPSVWRYSVRGGSWTEDESPKTSSGNNSEPGGAAVQRSAEGAGLSVPELGLSWYFGGHLDMSTTPGWSNQVARVYLKSLLEFTHPGYSNTGVDSLRASGAGEMGAYRNITKGRIQRQDAFFERADGALVFIPGWGDMGVLIGLGGGTNTTFADNLGTLDVYDIARSEWYHQETSGIPPSVRVNLCAVVASAPDASSFQIHVFGGQNLEPFGDQVQYDDMYILTIPSFTWIRVDKAGRNQPSPRAGHTCHMRDGQIVVTGGYVGASAACDSPGIYVFDATRLEWADRFDARSRQPDLHPENSVMAGSGGYRVPDRVISVIGGGPSGSATATAPASRATDGPFATGKSPVFTVTAAGGSTVTQTAWGAGRTGAPPAGSGGSSDGEQGKPAPGLVAAAVLAGLAGLLALYLGFCAWLYRRQVRAYRTHLAVANRYSGAGAAHASHASLGGIAAAFFGRKGSKESRDGGPGHKGRWGGGGGGGSSSRRNRRASATAPVAGRYGVLGNNDSGDERRTRPPPPPPAVGRSISSARAPCRARASGPS
ncbi:hypothetical protein GGTG_13759 [Gaeumannomyces tritici R3-111a-1]|uniref:Kelch repeat protein n=1 Tax=Gaeumannomyces tritici (strain R3-111a-1) TaxID=644352 RepID=J3PJS0_GAET3|nr:hypothetical protein GGTG_13759 [Gaeumannomyces tritici R3-111a-1]EJT68665.1 hypothetical protein GGTG_13759 [Gaeumannomyces tritici R3-111a-1]